MTVPNGVSAVRTCKKVVTLTSAGGGAGRPAESGLLRCRARRRLSRTTPACGGACRRPPAAVAGPPAAAQDDAAAAAASQRRRSRARRQKASVPGLVVGAVGPLQRQQR